MDFWDSRFAQVASVCMRQKLFYLFWLGGSGGFVIIIIIILTSRQSKGEGTLSAAIL